MSYFGRCWNYTTRMHSNKQWTKLNWVWDLFFKDQNNTWASLVVLSFFHLHLQILFVSILSINITSSPLIYSNFRNAGFCGEKLFMSSCVISSSVPSKFSKSYWNSRTLWTSVSCTHTHTLAPALIFYFSWRPESFSSICSAHCR